MKKLHVHDVYCDDGVSCIKVTIPAESKKSAAEYVRGNGDVVAIKESDLQDINCDCLTDTLRRDGWGKKEISLITNLLYMAGLERA